MKSTFRYSDVIISTLAYQITNLPIVYSTVYSGADQRKRQSSASLAFVRGIYRDRWFTRTKDHKRRKCFHLMTSSFTVTIVDKFFSKTKGNTMSTYKSDPKKIWYVKYPNTLDSKRYVNGCKIFCCRVISKHFALKTIGIFSVSFAQGEQMKQREVKSGTWFFSADILSRYKNSLDYCNTCTMHMHIFSDLVFFTLIPWHFDIHCIKSW